MKIYLAQINVKIADFEYNFQKIISEFEKAQQQNCDLIIFPELVLTGYNARDLFLREKFIDDANFYLQKILKASLNFDCAILFGSIYFEKNKNLFNVGFLIEKGEIKNIIKKKDLPNYKIFDEQRYFTNSKSLSYFEFRGQTLSVLICEDMWSLTNLFLLQEQIFDFVIVINASPFEIDKEKKRAEIAKNIARKVKKPLIYLNQIGACDSLVFDGNSFILDNQGQEILHLKKFQEDFAIINLEKSGEIEVLKYDFKNLKESTNNLEDIYQACVLGLRDYVEKNNFTKILLGMSGGIDSALVALIAADALGEENVKLYALPTKFNSKESMQDALEMAQNLGVKLQVIEIEEIFQTFLRNLENQEISQIAKENIQARIRGNILMALSNSSGAILLSTGNKSEMAVGYATLYGDMCGAFNPIKDLYKTQIYDIAKWRNKNFCAISKLQKIDLIPENIIAKEPTAELRQNQKDSDSLPKYEILDKILYEFIENQKSLENIVEMGYDYDLVAKIAKLLKNSEFKRHQAVLGPKISKMSFDIDRRYPIANDFKY